MGGAAPHLPASGLPAPALRWGAGEKAPFSCSPGLQGCKGEPVRGPEPAREPDSGLQGLPGREAGPWAGPLHTWAQVSLNAGLPWTAGPCALAPSVNGFLCPQMSGPRLLCIVFLISYLPGFNFLCVNIIIIIKGLSKVISLFGTSAHCPTLGDEASSGGGVVFWGLVQTSSRGGGGQGRGPGQVHCRRLLLDLPPAFPYCGCCQGNSRQPFPGPA